VTDITPRELLALLQTIENRGLYETAGRLRGFCGAVFRFAIATGRAERDPSMDQRGTLTTPIVSHRASIVNPAAIGALLRVIDGFVGQPTTHAALRLVAYTFARPGELRRAEWAEFDLDRAVWSIAAKKMKMRRPRRVPLARQSLAILCDIQKFISICSRRIRALVVFHGLRKRSPRLPRLEELPPRSLIKRVGDRHPGVGALSRLERLPVGMIAPDERAPA